MSRWFHPPKTGIVKEIELKKGFIIDENKLVAGFGNRDFYVIQITAKMARQVIMQNHYSHTAVNNSFVHLGLYLGGVLEGVLQFGYALNPVRIGHIVKDTVVGEYLELNRMWLSDNAPRNSESKAVSYAIKYIKKVIPSIAWIQSFADERCRTGGVVYQACNFMYCGSHNSEFYELDGETYHKLLHTAHKDKGKRGIYLRDNFHRAMKCSLRQFRYIYFIKRNWQHRLLFEVLPYPKLEH